MRRHWNWIVVLLAGMIVAGPCVHAAQASTTTIVCSKNAPSAEKLAAKEIRRYFYLRTGRLAAMAESPGKGDMVIVGTPLAQNVAGDGPLGGANGSLKPEQYVVRSLDRSDGSRVVLVVGGDAIGTLYGAYRFIELLGVRFYMHGDTVPDAQIPPELPKVDEVGKPLFALRGIQPFHDFPEGPDWWNTDDYKAIIGQLPKLRMNFIGLHTYPQCGVGPEPAVWIGRSKDCGPGGKVNASYPSRHFVTTNSPAWGYRTMKTSEYVFGADQIFDRDDYGADYMRDVNPWNKRSDAEYNALFDRMGDVLREAFGYARTLGVKTCIGTETPLVIPDAVKQRLRAEGKNPDDPAVAQGVYEGMFQRIAKTHPLDYYWLWTNEGWTWSPVSNAQVKAVQTDFRSAIAAIDKVKPGFTLATCGWVLGPPQSPSLFDTVLPKNMPMACISRTVGNSPVEPGFRHVEGRPRWSIPWMEDDPGITIPQFWVGRMRRDAADSLAYGCTGLMGIHWRTRVLGPNVSALAHAAWDQAGWNPDFGKRDYKADLPPAGSGKPRYLPCADFYEDWAKAEFGPKANKEIAAVFSRLDGHLPRPADWVTGPGSIRPDGRPWETVRKEYDFAREFAKDQRVLEVQAEGDGNIERHRYWTDQFLTLSAIAEVRCVWARYNAAIAKVKAEKSPEARKRLARELALPVRKELVSAFEDLHRLLLATISNAGEFGNLCNWQQQTVPVVLTEPSKELEKLLGEPLPADAQPSQKYVGPQRIIVPTVRTSIAKGEPFKLTVILAGIEQPDAALYWRPLGRGEFSRIPLTHSARSVFHVIMPREATQADFEYNIRVVRKQGTPLYYPATAPQLNQTVVTYD